MADLNDYACPECGYDGPHTLLPAEHPDEPTMAECGSCYSQFKVANPGEPGWVLEEAR